MNNNDLINTRFGIITTNKKPLITFDEAHPIITEKPLEIVTMIQCQQCEVLFNHMVKRVAKDTYVCPRCRHLNYNDNVKGNIRSYEVVIK